MLFIRHLAAESPERTGESEIAELFPHFICKSSFGSASIQRIEEADKAHFTMSARFGGHHGSII